MTMPTVTVKQFRQWRPCWDDARLDAYLLQYEDEPWTALDVLALRDVPVADRLWVVLREEMVPLAVLRKFAFWCADRARLAAADALDSAGLAHQAQLLRAPPPVRDEASANAAGAAARDARAAWAAGDAGAAAGAAARAAGDAARDAAWDAAGDARDAAWAAAGDAGAAEVKLQVKKLRALIRGEL